MELLPKLFLAILEGTVTSFVLATTALGLSLVFGVMRIVNVAHGEFYMLGAVIAWFLTDALQQNFSPLISFFTALLLSTEMLGYPVFAYNIGGDGTIRPDM